MTTPATVENIRPGGAFVKLALISTVTCVGIIAVGYWPTSNLAGPQGITGLLVGVAIALVGGWIATYPVVASLRRPGSERVNAILLSTALRFAITLALAAAAALSGFFDPKPLILWVAIAQLVVLAVDTIGLVRLVKQAERVSE